MRGRRILAAILSFSMAFACVPASAWAEGPAVATAPAPASQTSSEEGTILERLRMRVATRQEALANGQEELSEAQSALRSANTALASANTQASGLKATADQKASALESAEAALASAQQSEATAQAAVDAVDEDLTQERQSAADAQERIDSASEVLAADRSQLEAAVTAAQTRVNTANTEASAAQQAYDSGSFGFFESVDATAALDALRNSTYADLTEEGDPDDATSLENMRASFAHMKRLNQIRSGLGLSELKVNDTLMAYAQADANFSDTEIAHAQQFGFSEATGNTYGENVAWNNGTDPYLQWYDEEKAAFDQAYQVLAGGEVPLGADAYSWYQQNRDAVNSWVDANTGQSSVGHYMNDINPGYKASGFAVCTRGSMYGWHTMAQFFGGTADGA